MLDQRAPLETKRSTGDIVAMPPAPKTIGGAKQRIMLAGSGDGVRSGSKSYGAISIQHLRCAFHLG